MNSEKPKSGLPAQHSDNLRDVDSTRLLDDLIIILSEAVGELAVQDVDLHKGDVPGAKQRRYNADERITAAMRLVESMSNTRITETGKG